MSIRVCSIDEEGRFSGPERRITQIAKALKPLGVDTHVVYPTYDSARFARELSQAGVSNTALKITRLSAEKKVLARYTACFAIEVLRLCAFLRRERFDLVQVNGSQQFKGALAASLAAIPVIWVLEDALMAEVVRLACKQAASRLAAAIIVTAERTYDYYVRGTKLESKPVAVIHSHVDTAMFDPARVAPDTRFAGVPGRKIVTVTGINPTKGLEYFVEMASLLARRHEDLSFIVAGANYTSQGRYFKVLQRMVADSGIPERRFAFVGAVENVPPLLKAADVFVLTSISESSPMAVWEAMSMGKPVVTTDVGSVREYIEDGKSGFIVPIKDASALAAKVEAVLNDPALGQSMGHAAHETARTRLDVQIAAEKYATFYRTILQRQHLPHATGTAARQSS